ncbi:winged helix-turn-helix domain-containing protein [Kribbella turkmenica]|uniref:Winged helix-turn-helix domain-containing protein n=1 Tax=Kribbella turkmenica TaxID=2530375 RepID=A0A4R4X4E1_9ACTN|nr:crosslink repair DNA glycosylase YcaQ family protein [Kribbella turkmenica]TDD25188.1 winged helix-turn-helix domain-containing protein [Kribbella turkmenica]
MAATGEAIPVDTARRIALTAQGFADPRPSGRVDARHLRRVLERIGVLQVDSVNVVCRSHYLPLFARLGPYPRATLDRMSWGADDRELFEYFWGHKASLIPLSSYPLFRWRMRAAEQQDWTADDLSPDLTAPWSVVTGMRRLTTERPGYVDDVLALVTDRGPVTAGQASPDGVRRKRTDPDPDPSTGTMWNWQDAKIAIEYLYCAGRVTIAGRRNFERRYDLTERVLPDAVLREPEIGADEARRELVRIAARGLGVATARELCGRGGTAHFPLPLATARQVIGDLVDAGDLVPVRVDGVPQQSYLWSGAEDRPVDARALLSPFDTLIWNRDRTHRLFGFFYRISIYTPAAQRVHGYYVLPFLLGDRLVARVDLKADRRSSALVVPTVTAEDGVPVAEVVEPLAAELALMASWLELDRVSVTADSDLGKALRGA